MKSLDFSAVEYVALETSYGLIGNRVKAVVDYSIFIDSGNGIPYGFEIHCEKLDWVDSGQLEIEYNHNTGKLHLNGYDGVFELPEPIIEKLEEEFGIINNL